MTESEFSEIADQTLARIERAVEDCGADVDVELKEGGVLELEFADGSRIIVNRHNAAREIWVAARSGGYHFRYADGRWRNTRDGEELFSALARYIGEQAGEPVRLG
ncbi:MAG: iron donor protein CyaY [Pseudomonadota bacterium]